MEGDKPDLISLSQNIGHCSERHNIVVLRCFKPSGNAIPARPGAIRLPAVRAGKPVGAILMAKRTRSPRPTPNASARPQGRQPRPGIVHSSVYLPEALYEGLRRVAFEERRKINDIVLEGIELALLKRGRRK